MVANSTYCASTMTSLPNDYFPQIDSNKIGKMCIGKNNTNNKVRVITNNK